MALQWGEVFNGQLLFQRMQGFHKSVATDFYIGGHCVHSEAHAAQYFPSILREFFPSFLILTRGMKAHVFLRPNSELHKSQATTDSNAIDVDQLPPLHAALCLASLKGWFCFLQAQPFQANVHFRALWHIQRYLCTKKDKRCLVGDFCVMRHSQIHNAHLQ